MKKETADFSAISTWGVFELEDGGPRLMLLDVLKDRYEFPELRRKQKNNMTIGSQKQLLLKQRRQDYR